MALSTAEAEYVAMSSAAQEAVWLRKLNAELGNPPKEPTIILEDNQSAIAMAKNPQFHDRAKHIDIRPSFCQGAGGGEDYTTGILPNGGDGCRYTDQGTCRDSDGQDERTDGSSSETRFGFKTLKFEEEC